METVYAQALWDVIQRGMDPVQAVQQLNTKLTQEGRQKIWAKILFAFQRLAEKESTRSGLTLSVAGKKHEAQALKQALEAASHYALNTQNVAVQVDESLIGGWRLEGQETVIDASYKKDLLTIYQSATKAY